MQPVQAGPKNFNFCLCNEPVSVAEMNSGCRRTPWSRALSQVCSPGCSVVPARFPSADPATVSNSIQEKQGLFGISHAVSSARKETSPLICSQVLDSHRDTHYLGSWERSIWLPAISLRPFLVNLSLIPRGSFRGWSWHSGSLQWVISILSHHLPHGVGAPHLLKTSKKLKFKKKKRRSKYKIKLLYAPCLIVYFITPQQILTSLVRHEICLLWEQYH